MDKYINQLEQFGQLSLLYVAPVILGVVILALWPLYWKLRPIMGAVALLAVYASTAYILYHGKFESAVNVELVGMRLDLKDSLGKYRNITIGGGAKRTEKGGKADDIYVPLYPREAFKLALRRDKSKLVVRAGRGYERGELVVSGGQLVTLDDGTPRLEEITDGDKILFKEAGEPLQGEATLVQKPPARRFVSLQWKSAKLPAPVRIEVKTGSNLTIGGGLRDGFYVKGLPSRAFTLNVKRGELVLNANSELPQLPGVPKDLNVRNYPKKIPFTAGKSVRLGKENSPWGGTFTVASTRTLEWRGNATTRLELDGRYTQLPFVNKRVPLFQMWPYRTTVYPFNRLVPKESKTKSCILYGWPQKHSEWPNGAWALITEPETNVVGRKISRARLRAKAGLLQSGAPISFFQLETGSASEASSSSGSTRRILDIKKIKERRRFSRLSYHENDGAPYIDITFGRVRIHSLDTIPEFEDEDDVEEARKKPFVFSINDPLAFARKTPNVRFRGISDAFERATVDAIIPRGARGDTFTLRTGGGARPMKYGELFETEGDNRLLLRLTRRTASMGQITFVLLAGVVAVLTCFHLLARFGFAAILIGVSFVACSRVLFTHALQVNFPYDNEALPISNYLLVLVPVVTATIAAFVQTATRGGKSLGILPKLTLLAGLLFAVVFGMMPILRGMGTFKGIAVGGALIGSFILYLMIVFSPRRVEGFRKVIMAAVRGPSYKWLFFLCVLGIVLRLVFAVFGWKEAAVLGGTRIALSMFFVPYYVTLFAMGICRLLADRRRDGEFRVEPVFMFTVFNGFLMMCQLGSGFLVSDLGQYIYAIPPAIILAAAGGLILSGKGGAEGAGRMCGFLLFIPALMLYLVIWSPIALLEGVSENLADELTESEGIITDRNVLRALQYINPERLVEIGTDDSEVIAQDLALMDNYARRGWHGEGYLRVRVVSAKGETCKNDNVSAIFVFGQFGMIGGGGLMLAYILTIAGASIVFIKTGRRQSAYIGRIVATTSAIIFAASSIYMMAANLGLLPFTGRNLYMLGLNSLGDVYEGLILLAMMAFGAALTYQNTWRRRRLPKSAEVQKEQETEDKRLEKMARAALEREQEGTDS